jgi:hypothetical protein
MPSSERTPPESLSIAISKYLRTCHFSFGSQTNLRPISIDSIFVFIPRHTINGTGSVRGAHCSQQMSRIPVMLSQNLPNSPHPHRAFTAAKPPCGELGKVRLSTAFADILVNGVIGAMVVIAHSSLPVHSWLSPRAWRALCINSSRMGQDMPPDCAS